MRLPELIPGVFIERLNRFVARVRLKQGEKAKAYIPTTGRLTNALQPGCRVWLARSSNPHRKTQITMILTELPEGGLCSVTAIHANKLFAEAIASGNLEAFDYDQIEAEVTFGQSRLDFRLANQGGACWVEVKSVTYASDGMGKFPDAPTPRGCRHLRELASLAVQGERASVVFIAQREDVEVFMPFEEVDPVFAETLREVSRVGVEVHAYRCRVDIGCVELTVALPVRL